MEYFEAGGEVHPIRDSPGYSKEVEEVQTRERERQHQAARYRGVKRESSDVQRPEWARGMSEARVRAIARSVGRNPDQEFWWQGANLKPGTLDYRYAVTEAGAPRKKKFVERGMLRGRGQSRHEARRIATQSAQGGADLPF
jgi:hypothetical protein